VSQAPVSAETYHSLQCWRLFRPMGELLFIAIKSNQKALAWFRSKARLKICRPRRKRNSRCWASHASVKSLITRFLKTLANNFQPARSNGPAPAVIFGL